MELDPQQRRTLLWAGLAVVLTAFDGSVLVLALPAIAADFHARTPALSNLGSVLALGALGALPLATLADRFGRRRLIAVGVAGFSIANFLSGLATSLEALALLRLVAVCFEALVGGVATALIVEEAPPSRRGQAVSVLAVLAGLGTGITVIAYPLLAPHWRWLFLVGGLGVLAAPLIWIRLPEGRAWLGATGAAGVRVSGSALLLLLQPPWRRRVLVIALMSALLAILLEPAGLLFTVYASEVLLLSPVAISALIFVSGVAGGVSYLAGGYLSDRFGRRGPAIVLTVATAVAASLSFATARVGFYVGNVLWSVFASASSPVFG
ncbi:MAG TPA: MFS transporter, partial [Candidatus Dormibacteraeota bacterium]|nr:MFS transporter [Candidatus Dormibacteraeota bacterium]